MIKKISDSQPNVFVDNKINQVYVSKTLGVTVDQHLSWKSNTENIFSKRCTEISAIRRIEPYVNKQTLVSIFNVIVFPFFDHCCEVGDMFGDS